MNFAIATLTIPFFAQDETAGGSSKLSVWTRGATVRVNNRDAAGPLVFVPDIVGTVSPLVSKDLDITGNEGQKGEGHLQVTTLTKLQVADEATGENSMWVLFKGKYYFLEEEDDWDYAKGFVYKATLDRRQNGV